MEKLVEFIGSIDWLFAAIILIGGRYWGGKFFNITKNPALNFLAFATAFGGVWVLIKSMTVGLHQSDAANLFITYLFATSFYELLAKRLFEGVEKLFGKTGE